MQDINGYSFGLTKYIYGNGLKIHAGYSNYDLGNSVRENLANLMLQVSF